MHSETPSALRRRFHATGATLEDLWFRYISLTGTATPAVLDAYLRGAGQLDSEQASVLAQAVWELEEDGAPESEAADSPAATSAVVIPLPTQSWRGHDRLLRPLRDGFGWGGGVDG